MSTDASPRALITGITGFVGSHLAELLLDHYPDERAEAVEHLDFAIREFQEMKMQPSLERALRHRELLRA